MNKAAQAAFQVKHVPKNRKIPPSKISLGADGYPSAPRRKVHIYFIIMGTCSSHKEAYVQPKKPYVQERRLEYGKKADPGTN